jgi:creatinine amidohydrolase
MKLADATWMDVEGFSREAVVVVPTGSLEQHGPHLPLFTDSLIVTAVAEAVESRLQQQVLLAPTLWLGASGHHLKFPGSLSASFDGYLEAVRAVVESLIPHGFHKFFVLNGHGGNNEPNGMAMRALKASHPDLTFGHAGYYSFIAKETARTLTGPLKEMAHACEAETSVVLHLRPDLVRKDRIRDDGLRSEPALQGMVHHFDQFTEQGSYGFATYATAEKGERLFLTAVEAVCAQISALATGYLMIGITASE